MFLNTNQSADGFYGIPVQINLSGAEQDFTYAISPNWLRTVTLKMAVGKGPTIEDARFELHEGDWVYYFTSQNDPISNTQWALCAYSEKFESTDEEGNDTYSYGPNEFVYILSERIDYSQIAGKMANGLIQIGSPGQKIDIPDEPQMNGPLANASCGEVWVCNSEGTYVMNSAQAMINAHEKCAGTQIPNLEDRYIDTLHKGTPVSAFLDSNGNYIIDKIWGNSDSEETPTSAKEYLLIVYKGVMRYVYKDSFIRYTDIDGPAGTVCDAANAVQYATTEFVNANNSGLGMFSDQVVNYTGSYSSNKSAGNFSMEYGPGYRADVIAQEIIDGRAYFALKFNDKSDRANRRYRIIYALMEDFDLNDLLYIPNIVIDQQSGSSLSDDTKYYIKPFVSETYKDDEAEQMGSRKYEEATEWKVVEKESSVQHNGGDKTKPSWYEQTLPVNKYPNVEMDKQTGAAYLSKNQDTLLPASSNDYVLFNQIDGFELHNDPNTFIENAPQDTRQLNKINRFRFLTDMTGLSTKSFIFMTKPDLNLYALDENDNIKWGQMNPDLKRISEFKYIARNKQIGSAILDSLEYWGTDSLNTPWLSIISNQACGYTPVDREIGYTEVGETFHGHKVLYGKHDFKHNVAGTVTIPFNERRDLCLYYTLKIWTEYIHNLNLGKCSPHPVHIKNAELDYAVSLYYITTDETMENILYWEKLTGVFPLKCPDSFFDWNKGRPEREMGYDIEFAYSMRSVLKTQDLYELNRLYMKGSSTNDAMVVPYNKDFVNDPRNNEIIARMAAYYGIDDDAKRVSGLPDNDPEKIQWISSYINGDSDISRFYYEPYKDAAGNEYKFLANYCPSIRTHGIPYVKGPYIVPAPGFNGGKFLLKWV